MSDKAARIPTEKEILKLPRWARVGLAARCARRVQPIYTIEWPNAPKEHLDAIERAITGAEESARVGWADVSIMSNAAARATDAHAATMVAHAPYAATSAIAAATRAIRATVDDDAAHLAATSAYAAYTYTNAANYISNAAGAGIRADYERLLVLAREEAWTDETPVDPDWLGPLWPLGKPIYWPAARSADGVQTAMQFEFAVPADLSVAKRGELTAKIASFYAALSAAHVQMGGTGLRILDEAGCLPAPIFDEAPNDFPSGTGAGTRENDYLTGKGAGAREEVFA